MKFSDVAENYDRIARVQRSAGIQAPATGDYCPNFIKSRRSREKLGDRKRLRVASGVYGFLENEDEYADLFEKCGFDVVFCRIETERSHSRGSLGDL